MPDALQDIRRKIDALDARLVSLISERAKLAQRVGEIKGGALVYRPEREAQVLRRVSELNRGPMPAAGLRFIRSGLEVSYLVAARVEDILPMLRDAAHKVTTSGADMKTVGAEQM